jgi:hypothetical protein
MKNMYITAVALHTEEENVEAIQTIANEFENFVYSLGCSDDDFGVNVITGQMVLFMRSESVSLLEAEKRNVSKAIELIQGFDIEFDSVVFTRENNDARIGVQVDSEPVFA